MSSLFTSPLPVAGALCLLFAAAACGSSDTAGTNGGDGGGGGGGGVGTTDGGKDGSGGGSGDGGQGGEGGGVAPGAVNLGSAGTYVILAKTGVTTVPTSAVTGNLGVSPAAASFITGFALTADASNVFSTSPQVTGKVFGADYAVPTPSNLTTAVADMQTAFTDAAGRAPTSTELGAGNIGGMTLTAGVYKWGSGLLVPTNVTLSGSGTDVFIFQVAQNLTVSKEVKVLLQGGVAAKNVFWQVSGLVDLDTTSHLEGVVLGQTSIALHTGASINGRLLAQTLVSIESSKVVEPAP
jgi:hypothetical protein